MVALSCPHCESTDIIRFGKNESGSPRLRCKACGKTWSPAPKSRALSSETEAAIVRALGERTSQRGIARTFKVSRETVRALRKKTQSEWPQGDCLDCQPPTLPNAT